MSEIVVETADVKSLEEMANETPIIRFVNLVLFQACADGATQIVFACEDIQTSKRSTQVEATKSPDDVAFNLLKQAEANDPREDEAFNELNRILESWTGKFSIKYFTHGSFYEMAPPPAYLYWPVICRLCVLSGIRYWKKGRVEGFLLILTIANLGRIDWIVQSDDLRSSITLTKASPTQIEEFELRETPTVPPLPAPMPDEPLPEYAFRPVTPPSALHAVVWFVSRMLVFSFAHSCVLVLLAVSSLNRDLSPSLIKAFDLAARSLLLPASLLQSAGVSWQVNGLLWGAAFALIVHCATKFKH